MSAVQDQVGAAHMLQMALQRERSHARVGLSHGARSEHPLDVHGEAEVIALRAPHVVHRPDGAV
ncbi:hypothetical protein D3C83_201310 [compost metagenome]